MWNPIWKCVMWVTIESSWTFRKGPTRAHPDATQKNTPGYWALMSQRLGVWRVQGQRISIFWGISFQHLSESGSSSIRIAKLQRRVPEMRNWVIAEWLASIICILFLDVENDLVVKNWLLCIFSCELNFGVGLFLLWLHGAAYYHVTGMNHVFVRQSCSSEVQECLRVWHDSVLH